MGGLFADAMVLVGNRQNVPDIEFEAETLTLWDKMMLLYLPEFRFAGLLVLNGTVSATKDSVSQPLGICFQDLCCVFWGFHNI